MSRPLLCRTGAGSRGRSAVKSQRGTDQMHSPLRSVSPLFSLLQHAPPCKCAARHAYFCNTQIVGGSAAHGQIENEGCQCGQATRLSALYHCVCQCYARRPLLVPVALILYHKTVCLHQISPKNSQRSRCRPKTKKLWNPCGSMETKFPCRNEGSSYAKI